MTEAMTGNKVLTHTDSEKGINLKIKFRIEKFASLMKTTEPGEGSIWSEGVTSELVPRAIWKLNVDPNGDSEEHKGNIGVFLHLTGPMKDNKEHLEATYHLYANSGTKMSNKHRASVTTSVYGQSFSIGRSTENFGKESYNWGSHVSHVAVKKALRADGSLLVAADLEFLLPDKCGAKAIDEGTLSGYEDLQRWATNFSKLYGDQAFSDCSIKIGGASIPAHKSVLAAHSPIFRSMFAHQEAEEFKSGVVRVTDFKEPEPMRALVRYCYQGLLDDATMNGDGALEIFKLADRYCITGLKAHLEEHFIRNTLSVENVITLAVLADAHSAVKLKEACIELIVSEGSTIFEIDEWKERSDWTLIAEVFQLASKYRIGELKAQLEKHFVDRQLNVGNVVSMAVLADAYTKPDLKEACVKLIAQEWKTVFGSADWKEMKKVKPELAAELAEAAIAEK